MNLRIALLLGLGTALALSTACKKKTTAPDAAVQAPAPAKAAPVPPPPPPTAAPAPTRGPGMNDPLLKLLPKKIAAAFLLPSMEDTGRLLKMHLDRHAEALGIKGRVDELLRSVGLGLANLFDPASRERWGVDARRSAGIVLSAEGNAAVLAFGVTRFDTFEKHAKARMQAQGMTVFDTVATDAGKITVARRGTQARIAFGPKGDYVFVAPAAEGIDPKIIVEAALKTAPADSLAANPVFQATAGKLSAFEDALLFFDGDGLYSLQTAGGIEEEEKQSLRRIYDVLRGFAIAVNLTEKDLHLEMYASLGEAARWAKLFSGATDFALGKFIEAGATVVAKAVVDGPALLDKILEMDPTTKTRLASFSAGLEKRLGLNVERDVLRNLSGRFAAAFHGFDPTFIEVALDSERRGEALQQMHLVAAAELKDAAALRKAIDTAVSFLQKRGASARLGIAEKTHGKHKYYALSHSGRPVLSVAILENVLVATLGKGRMERTLDLVSGKGRSVLQDLAPAARAALASEHNAVGVIDLGALLRNLKALDFTPLGKRGFAMREFIDTKLGKILEQLHDFVAQARFDGQGVRMQASIRGR